MDREFLKGEWPLEAAGNVVLVREGIDTSVVLPYLKKEFR